MTEIAESIRPAAEVPTEGLNILTPVQLAARRRFKKTVTITFIREST